MRFFICFLDWNFKEEVFNIINIILFQNLNEIKFKKIKNLKQNKKN